MQGRGGGPGGGPGGRDPFSGGPFGGFGGFGSFGPSGSLMSNFFGGRDPFDDPFFTQPFGGMFQSSILGGPSRFPFPPEMQHFTQNMQNMQLPGFPFHPDMHPSGFLEHQARAPAPAPEPSSRRGPIIQELDSDDENEDAEERKENPKKHRRSNTEPSVEHPDDGLEGNMCLLFRINQ